MSSFFPKHTHDWHFEEPTVIRRLSRSLVEVAVFSGIVLRLYRALVTTPESATWVWFLAFVGGLLFLCAMATLHLANFPLERWLWRAPLFAVVEAAAEAATSLALIGLRREPSGTARAEWSDWLPMAGGTLWTRVLIVCAWAAVLAAMIWLVRRTILREEVVEEDPIEDTAQA